MSSVYSKREKIETFIINNIMSYILKNNLQIVADDFFPLFPGNFLNYGIDVEIDSIIYDQVCEQFNIMKVDNYLFKEINSSGKEVYLSVSEAVQKLLGGNDWLQSQ